jgi:DNA invertase Pin-like site-specific DNA recombinase
LVHGFGRRGGINRPIHDEFHNMHRSPEGGAHFRSLGDPIDTSGPSGMLVLQIVGAIAQFERSLIVERTKAGLASARAQGRVGGQPRPADP